MKKIVAIIGAVLFVFTLSSCTTEEKEITIIVYSENPQETVSNLEDLPEVIATELQALGYEFTRVVLQASNDVSVMESSVINGLADMAIIDPTMLTSNVLDRVLNVAMDEMNHPDSNEDAASYEKAIVLSNTVAAEEFKSLYELVVSTADINTLNVCAISEDEDLVVLFGDTAINDLTSFTSSSNKTELYEGLEDGTCDLGVVTLEEVSDYSVLWDDGVSIYEGLSVIQKFEAVYYQGFYVSPDAEELLVNSLIQSFIQLSAHSTNRELLEALGHDSYLVPTE